MTACPSCSGIPGNVLACGDMCANVMKGCLAQHAQLDADWNHFVGKLNYQIMYDRILHYLHILIVQIYLNIIDSFHRGYW